MKYQLTLEWTLAICVRHPTPVGTRSEYVQDLDATLTIAYWREDDGYGWELDEIEVHGITVTPKSDPAFWAIVDRAVDYHESTINERVQECAHERSAA